MLQKAGTHMEHTMVGSYIVLLLGHVVMESTENEIKVRNMLPNPTFQEMLTVLKRYFSFLNLTASVSLSHTYTNTKIHCSTVYNDVNSNYSGRSSNSSARKGDGKDHQLPGRLRQEAQREERGSQHFGQRCDIVGF